MNDVFEEIRDEWRNGGLERCLAGEDERMNSINSHTRRALATKPDSHVRFDPETFEEIRRRAIKEGTSFAEQVRILVEWGLEA
ncbi:hypothetical protein LCGC14_0960870 [marine sediment metagenome]|uniref:Uncharacterized protein n=1 Tax=marine sediment metagenome TaxID=412755 RepID=A0A0F9QXQ5_9ZZZZ